MGVHCSGYSKRTTEGRKPNCAAGKGVVREGFLEEVTDFH